MEVSKLRTKDIFGGDCQIVVPLYQRPYVWTQEGQWEPLWENIRALAEELLDGRDPKPHFLGAIVLDQLKTPLGSMDRRLIIDGQQRLTTVQILLEALVDISARLQNEGLRKSLLKLTRNDDLLSGNEDERFKVWPSNVDRKHFVWVMDSGSPDELIGRYDPASTKNSIAEAYIYFYQTIETWLMLEEDGAKDRLTKLLVAIRDLLLFVVIDLSADEDAQLIFETLNARMTPLLQADLVKNSVFYSAHLEKMDVPKLYRQYWEPFDLDADYWRKQIARGRVYRPRIEHFLQNFLALMSRGDVKYEDLYKVFRDVASHSKLSAAKQLELMHRYGALYAGFDRTDLPEDEALFFSRLRDLEITTVFPLLLKLYNDYADQPDELAAMRTDLGSYIVRRLVCRLTTSYYNKIFVDLIGALEAGRKTKRSPSELLREALLRLDAETTRWPRDEEFRRKWAELPVYGWLGVSRVRMLLEAIERQLRTDLSEKISINDKLSIEHLLPQKWQQHWPLPKRGPMELVISERETLLHTFGNLTLVTPTFNTSVSNRPWQEKQAALKEQSALAMNRRLVKNSSWNDAKIKTRGAWMADLAIKIWPIPEPAG